MLGTSHQKNKKSWSKVEGDAAPNQDAKPNRISLAENRSFPNSNLVARLVVKPNPARPSFTTHPQDVPNYSTSRLRAI